MTDSDKQILLQESLLCQNNFFSHVRIAMGYNYVPDDLNDLCLWLDGKWDVHNPVRRNLLIQVMRDSYKSTCITQSYPSYILKQNPDLAILIVSKNFANAQNFHDVQRKRFEQKDFIKRYGTWKNTKAKWDSEKMYIRTRTKHRKEPSIMCAGINTGLTSLHFDVIILDDITGMEDMYSPAEREASYRFYKSVFDLLDKHHGLLIVVGTCWHEDDVLERIKKQNKQKIREGVEPFKIYYRPAYFEGKEPVKYNFTWVDDKFIKQIREDKADIRDFSANYLLKPLPDSYKIFHLDKLHYFEISDIKQVDWIVMFIDPSLRDTKKSDFAAIVWIGQIKGKLYLLDCDIKQRKPSETIKAIGKNYETLQKKYNCEIFVYMESVAFQEFMCDEAVNQLCNENKYVPIIGYPQKENKIARITAMEKYFSSGIVLFRKDWELLEDYKICMEQLSGFPLSEHDDAPDAIEGAVKISMQMV